MKRSATFTRWTVLACALVVAGGHFFAHGDSGDTAPEGENTIALLDVSKVFKEHKRFREQLEVMKRDVEAAETRLRNEGDKIRELVDELKALEAGEPLREKLEVEVAERQARVQLQMNLQKRDFMQREATIYREVYGKIETAVAEHSRARGIKLVLRFNIIELNEHSERKEVLAGVNRAVVFQDGIDITDEILKRLNRTAEEGDL